VTVHQQLLEYLRENIPINSTYRKYIDEPDDVSLHNIFQSYRKGDAKGLRLKWIGFKILREYFQPYEVAVPADYKLGSRDLLYLDAKASMPYYIGRGEGDEKDAPVQLFVFESRLAILLRLTGGMVSGLRNIS
jgi:hypothetical protein